GTVTGVQTCALPILRVLRSGDRVGKVVGGVGVVGTLAHLALPLLAAEVRKRPDDAYAAYYLAYAFVGAQDPQPAVTLLTKIIEVHPDFTDARTLLGLARIRISDFAGAAVEYDAVLAREPKNAAALLGQGMIAFWKRETAVADDY